MQQRHLQNSGRIIDMKKYTVEITNEALTDMDQLYNHIAYVFHKMPVGEWECMEMEFVQ